MSERIVESQYLYRGRILNLRIDQVEIDDGRARVVTREVVEHRGAVAVVALDARARVLMVRQFRSGTQSETLEIPAGTLEEGEDPAVCAVRELQEETGAQAKQWTALGTLYPSPGYATEKMYLYRARKLTTVQASPEDDESIRTEWVPLKKAVRMIERGEIMDAKTIVALLRVWMKRRRTR